MFEPFAGWRSGAPQNAVPGKGGFSGAVRVFRTVLERETGERNRAASDFAG